MSTRSKILIGNLLLLLAYSAYFTMEEIRHPPWGHSVIDNITLIATCMFFQSFFLVLIAMVAGKRAKDWLMALGLVLVIGFSVCRGSGEVVSSGRYRQYAVPRDSNGYFIEKP